MPMDEQVLPTHPFYVSIELLPLPEVHFPYNHSKQKLYSQFHLLEICINYILYIFQQHPLVHYVEYAGPPSQRYLANACFRFSTWPASTIARATCSLPGATPLPAIFATCSHLRGNFSLFSFKIMSLARRKRPSLMLAKKFSSSSYFDGPQLLQYARM